MRAIRLPVLLSIEKILQKVIHKNRIRGAGSRQVDGLVDGSWTAWWTG